MVSPWHLEGNSLGMGVVESLYFEVLAMVDPDLSI